MSTSAAYRDPSALVAPGRVFRTARAIVLGSLGLVALVALFCFVGRVVFGLCNDSHFYYQCKSLDLGPALESIGVPPSWVSTLAGIPTTVPATLFVIDVLVAFLFVRPRSATLDPSTRTLQLKATRWLRRPRVVRLRFEDIEIVEVRVTWRVLFTVRLLDARGRSHVVSGLGFGRRRAESIARALEEAVGLEALPDDEWLCAVRAVREANDFA
jgi:hypothetical protein